MLLRKKIVAILTSLACMISVMCVFGQISNYSSQANKVSALSGLTANEITSQMTIGWNLGNSLDSYSSNYTIDIAPNKFATAWGNPEPTKELIKTIKNAGFNTIRIPTTWYQHVTLNDATGAYEIDQKWLDYVKQVVDWAYDEDMFIILNLHHEEGIINVPEFTDDTLKTASKYINNLWSQIAYTFKDYDQHLIFEGMNEPRQKNNSAVSEWGNGSGDNGYSWAYVNTLNRQFITTVRGSNSENNQQRLLMIPAYVATTDTAALNSLSISSADGNIAISVHAYSPYFFTMDTSNYANHQFPGKSGYGEDYESSLKSLFNSLKSVSDTKGVPIIIGEFSASDFENTADRVEWAKCYLSNAKEAGIPCVLWDNNVSANGTGEAHGYIYRLTNTIYPNSADVLKAMMDTVGVTNYVLPEYKEYEVPKFSWDNIPIEDNWIEIYKSESGETLKSWGNVALADWKQYLTDDYKFALVFDSTTDAELVLQASAKDGWYRIPSNSSSNFVAYFNYQDMIKILDENSATLSDVDNLFLSATSSSATMYGLYAVPVNSTTVTTTTSETSDTTVTTTSETSDTTVTTTSETSDTTVTTTSETIDTTTTTVTTSITPIFLLGDVNDDGAVKSNDLLLLKKYLLGLVELSDINFKNSDMNSDGDIKSNDLLTLKKVLLGID